VTRPEHPHGSDGHDLLFVEAPGAPSGWLVWDGHSYVWIQID
jgi:hypothetical protein